MKKLLITGASGFLGWNLINRAKSDWKIFGTYFSQSIHIKDTNIIKVDITRFKDLKQAFHQVRPHAVIHTAAMSEPNICQKNPSQSLQINTNASINIAGLCSDLHIPCIFTSTDLVFDGLAPPYKEEDKPSPISIYGEHKVLAENGMKNRYPETIICRMPLMFGNPGPVAESFIQPLIRSMVSGNKVHLFEDELRTPVSGRDAAEGLIMALNALPSIIHLGGPERISRYDFGKLLASTLNISNANIIIPCSQKDVGMPAPRPPDVSFDSAKAIEMGFKPNMIQKELKWLAKGRD